MPGVLAASLSVPGVGALAALSAARSTQELGPLKSSDCSRTLTYAQVSQAQVPPPSCLQSDTGATQMGLCEMVQDAEHGFIKQAPTLAPKHHQACAMLLNMKI